VILNGSGDVFLTGNNTYTGPTAVNAGALHIGNGGTSGALGTGNVTLVGGNLHFARGDAMNVSAAIAGEGQVTQDGTGTTTYSGVATHTGGTFVNEGALFVMGSISGTTTVDGGDLGGTGVLGAVDVLSGNLVPGDPVGTLRTGNLAFSPGSALLADINTFASYAAVSVTGTTALNNAALSLTGSYTASTPGDLFFILRNDGIDALTGTFLGLPQGSLVEASNGQDFTISYTGNFDTLSTTGGNDVVLTAIPEPASIAIFLGGLGVLCARRRRHS